MMKTTVMEKGRGDTGCAMWNQVLLGNGRVKEQGGGPCPPTPTHYKFCSHPISSALWYWPPDLNLPNVLPFLQFLALPSGSLEGFCVAIQGLRKGCHGSHHSAQLPGLNLASESLQEAVRVPTDLLDPQVPPQSPLFLQGGTPGHQCCSHGFWVPSPRAGPRHITKAPESAPPCASGVLCPGPGSDWLRSSIAKCLLCPPGSARTQFFLLGPGSLSEEPLLLLLLPPVVPRALSPWGSAGSLCLTLLLLLALLGMFPSHAI